MPRDTLVSTIQRVIREHPDRHVFEINGRGASGAYTQALVALVLLRITDGRSVVLRLVDPAAPRTGISRSHPWRRFARERGRVTPHMLAEYARRLQQAVE